MQRSDLNPGSDSFRWLQMAEKLLTTRDLHGSKSFAMKARECDPNSEAAEQILAIVDTLIAGDKEMSSNSNHLDWYSILQLARRTHDSELIGLQYKRLGVLLNPNRNRYPFAEHAYKLVTEAWLVLSNPSRKFQFDNEFGNSNFNLSFVQSQFKTPRVEEQQQNAGGSGGGGVHFDFMQDGSGEQLRDSSSMQFVEQQQQQQLFAPQAVQQQQDAQNLTRQLNWSNQGKQPLVRPHSRQTWFQQPEPQTNVQHLQPQLHQPQLLPQSQLKKPLPESREESMQPLHWAQNVPQHSPLPQPQPQPQPQPRSWMQQALPSPQIQQSSAEPLLESQELRQQPLHSSQAMPRPPLETLEQPQHPLYSSQTVPQPSPLSQPQPWRQESLPRPQIQTSSPKTRSQPEKTPPQSREWVNNGEEFNLGENGDNHDNVSMEEPSNFWTVCAYCYSMYEYSGIYADCTLRCQNCKKAFHAVRTEAPPAVADGEDAYICCWGYFPIGVSMSYLEKRKTEASSWQPFSKMFAFPRGGNMPAPPRGGNMSASPQGGNMPASPPVGTKPRNRRNSGPRIYIDDDEVDIFDGISSNEESDDDWQCAPKNKKARSFTRKVSTAIKVKQPLALVQDSNTGNLHSRVVAPDGSGVSGPDAAVPIVAEAAVPSVPVPKAAMDNTDKAVVETSKKKMSVPTRKQPGRVAKDLGKLDGVVAQEGSDVSVSVINRNQSGRVAKDLGNLNVGDVAVAQEGMGVSVPEAAEVSVPTRKQPVSVAKDLKKLDIVVAEGGLVVSIPGVAAGSDPARNRPGRVAKDSGKLDGVRAQEGSGVNMPDSPVVSITTRKQPGRVGNDSGKLDGIVAQERLGVSVPDLAAPTVPVAEANKIVMGEAEKKAVGGSSRKRVSVPTRKQPGRVAKDLGKLDLNVEFNNEVEGPAHGTSGGGKAENGAEENVDGVAFFDGLDEYLSSLPILSADTGDKAKAV